MRHAVVLAALALAAGTGCGGGSETVTVAGNAGTGTTPAASPATTSALSATATASAVGAGSAVAVGTATASPAGTVTATRSATATPSRSAAPGTLGESDSGRTIHVRVGQEVEVNLPADYDPPQSNSAVMRRVSTSGGYPTGRPAVARFAATGAGSADLTSVTDAACLHTTPRCMIAQREWIVHVVVS